MYAVPLDLIAHANRARLIGQLAGNDFAVMPSDASVLQFFETGIADPAAQTDMQRLKARVLQAIENASGEIDGYLALFPSITLPTQTLKTACIDMAIYRLFEHLDDNSVIKRLYDQHIAFFDKIATGKIPINADESAKTVATGSAETVGSDVIFTTDMLTGY